MALPRFVKVGRLSKDIELKYTVSGTEIAKTSIVWGEKNGEKEETCFMDLVAFGKTATTLNNYFKKGSRVEGLFKLQQENWTASDGINRSKHSLVLEKIMEFIDKKDDNQESQRPQQKQDPRIEYEHSSLPEISIDEDSIPFAPLGLQYPYILHAM